MSNDEFQDIEEDNMDQFDEEFETGGGASLGELWKHSPVVKIGVVLAGFIIILGGIILFGGEEEQIRGSRNPGGSGLRGSVGTEEVSPEMQREIEQFNIEQVETAIEEGGSALPVPITTPRGGVLVNDQESADDDPLKRWRRIQEERQKREQQQQPSLPEVDPNAETIDALAKAMLTQMQGIVDNRGSKGMNFVAVTNEESFNQQMEQSAQPYDDGTDIPEEAEPLNIIVPAGTIEYAQLMIEANSDVPGPVLAQIVSGPLKGSRILGRFSVQDKYLTLDFNAVVMDGISQGVQAVALNPQTTNRGLVTEYDARLFKRVFLPAAAEFVSGFAEAVSDTNTTTVTVDGGTAIEDQEELDTEEELYAGLEEGVDVFSNYLDDEAGKTKALVRVAAGTPIAILFTQPVTEQE